MCGLYQHIIRPPPSLIFVRSLGNSPLPTHLGSHSNEAKVLFPNICGPLNMILPLENQDLSLLDICPIGVIFLFSFFPLEVSETTIPFGLLRLVEQLVPCSTPTNALARLRLFANTVPTVPFKA
ncbi:hypothetical protein BHE74_00018570 [Ensete ventricosum]|nr:hypothetical protein BHE74_00018570 [Ensete ventricosum]